MSKPLSRFAAELVIGYVIGYTLTELYTALRPVTLTDEIRNWMETNRGRFAQYLAQRDRDALRERLAQPAPRDDD